MKALLEALPIEKNPKIELLVLCPSKDKKSVEKVENGFIEEYADKYDKKLLNIKANPNELSLKLTLKMKNSFVKGLLSWIKN